MVLGVTVVGVDGLVVAGSSNLPKPNWGPHGNLMHPVYVLETSLEPEKEIEGSSEDHPAVAMRFQGSF